MKIVKTLTVVFAVFVILLAASVFISFETFSRSHDLGAKEIFETFIVKPVPSKVELIRGKGTWWQGYSFDLIFKADKDTFEQVLTDYQLLPGCLKDDIDVRQRNSFLREEIKDIPQLKCYYKRSTVRSGGDLYFLLDSSANKAYFYGNGG